MAARRPGLCASLDSTHHERRTGNPRVSPVKSLHPGIGPFGGRIGPENGWIQAIREMGPEWLSRDRIGIEVVAVEALTTSRFWLAAHRDGMRRLGIGVLDRRTRKKAAGLRLLPGLFLQGKPRRGEAESASD